jgi:hypothetical protein
MRYTRSHAPILSVLEKAGVNMRVDPASVSREKASGSMEMTPEDQAQWMEQRRLSLARLRGKKKFRRGGEQWCAGNLCEMVPNMERPLSFATDSDVFTAGSDVLDIGQVSEEECAEGEEEEEEFSTDYGSCDSEDSDDYTIEAHEIDESEAATPRVVVGDHREPLDWSVSDHELAEESTVAFSDDIAFPTVQLLDMLDPPSPTSMKGHVSPSPPSSPSLSPPPPPFLLVTPST